MMWTCKKCGAKVDSTFEVCWSCGTSVDGVEDPNFVPADQASPIEEPSVIPSLLVADTHTEGAAGEAGRVHLTECYRALDLMQARFIADQLTAAGIPAVSDTHDLHEELGTLEGGPRVYVRGEDLAAARDWLAAYERKTAEHIHE